MRITFQNVAEETMTSCHLNHIKVFRILISFSDMWQICK